MQPTGEIFDLLEYIHSRLLHRHGVSHMHPVTQVGIHHRSSWHVSIEDHPEIVLKGSVLFSDEVDGSCLDSMD